MKKKTVAYSYARCSTARQQGNHGKSLDRQIEDAKKYAAEKGYQLSSENVIDEIVSGFKGKNITEEGNLGAFLKKAEGGKLKGCVLILEDLDRFSRTDPTVAVEVFLALINAGVTIATLGDRPKEYRKAELNEQMGELFMTVNEFFRSHGESRRKRNWAQKKWAHRREMASEGKIFKIYHPEWLRFVPDKPDSQEGVYVAIEERANVIRKIFTLFNDGVTVYGITKLFNQQNRDGIKRFSGKPWAAASVKHYLRSRSVLGEYQPTRIIDGKRIAEGDPVKGFFPAIIDERDFDRAQARCKIVPHRNGRPPVDESVEILSGLIRCPYCSATVGVHEEKTKHLLACNNAPENACVRVGISRHFVEWSAAASTKEIIDSISLGEKNSQVFQALEGRLSSIKKKIQNLVDLAADGIPEVKQKLIHLGNESQRVTAELEQERNLELTNEDDGDAFVEAFVTNKMTKEIRMKAMFHIRRFVAKIEPYFLGDRKTYDKYRADLAAAEASGVKRGSVWMKLRRKHRIEEKQFIRITFTRPIDGKVETVITYQQYLQDMRISGVTV